MYSESGNIEYLFIYYLTTDLTTINYPYPYFIYLFSRIVRRFFTDRCDGVDILFIYHTDSVLINSLLECIHINIYFSARNVYNQAFAHDPVKHLFIFPVRYMSAGLTRASTQNNYFISRLVIVQFGIN